MEKLIYFYEFGHDTYSKKGAEENKFNFKTQHISKIEIIEVMESVHFHNIYHSCTPSFTIN